MTSSRSRIWTEVFGVLTPAGMVSVRHQQVVVTNSATDLPPREKRRPIRLAKVLRLAALVPIGGSFAGGPVDSLVCDVAAPRVEPALQGLPRRELAPRDAVSLHVPAASLDLALGAGAVRSTRSRHDVPVLAEREELLVELHLSRLDVVVVHECTSIVHQHLTRDPEPGERVLHGQEPLRLSLAAPRKGREPSRVPQRQDADVHALSLPGDRRVSLREVHLELLSRRGLEPRRRLRLHPHFLPVRDHRPFDGPKRDFDALLREQLVNDVCVPAVLQELCP